MSPSPQLPGCRLPPELVEDTILEILIRLPAERPEALARSALVCESWRRLVLDPAFLHLYREFHSTPPLLGFLYTDNGNTISTTFFPTAKFCPPQPVRSNWLILDSRHGRALFLLFASDQGEPTGFIVWDPVTNVEWVIPDPTFLREISECWTAAVLCGAEGCDHLDCHGGSFLVAIVSSGIDENIYTCVYSSESGSWNEVILFEHPDTFAVVDTLPSVVVVNKVYFPCMSSKILEYDIGGQKLALIATPFVEWNNRLITTEDGMVGVAGVQMSTLSLWSREEDPEGALVWVQQRVIELTTVLPSCVPLDRFKVVAFAEGIRAILIRNDAGVFTFDLQTSQVSKVSSHGEIGLVYPYMSFYTPDLARAIVPPVPPIASSSGNN